MAKGKWVKVDTKEGSYMRTNPRSPTEKKLGDFGAKIDKAKKKVKGWI